VARTPLAPLAVAAVVIAAATLAPTAARAQFPFPFGQGEERPEPKPRSATTDTSTVATNDKTYVAPEPVALPEGPAEILDGFVAVVRFDAMVNPGMGQHVASSIERAKTEGAQLLLIELDTPGGLVTATQDIVQSILSAPLPVVVFVSPSGAHAASAGTFITLAAHVAAMAPATRIGAAHPVTGGGKDPEESGGKHMARKIENDLLAMVEGIAKERNRNVEWAKDAVRDSVSADAQKAAEIGVVDLVADDRDDLFRQLDGRELDLRGRRVQLSIPSPEVRIYEPSMRNQLLNLMASPGIAAILGLLGLIGILIEIYNPGLIIPGVVGVLAILCSLIAVEQLPIDVGGALLIAGGLGLLFAELYTPTFGALGVLGIIGLGLGLVIFVDTGNPDFDLDPSFALSVWDVLPALLLMGGFIVYLSVFVLRKKRQRSTTGLDSFIGQEGRVLTPVGPDAGQVFISGEYWAARAQSDQVIPASARVRVVGLNGLELLVEAVESGS
jgi:membrane-bound serine protease (ClpP class)